MRWFVLILFLFSSCTAYNHNLSSDEISRAELEKIKVDDKVLLVLREEVDEKTYLRGRFDSLSDEVIFISVKRQGENQIIQIPISNIRKIKHDENVPATILKAGVGVTGSIFVVALIAFLTSPDLGVSGF